MAAGSSRDTSVEELTELLLEDIDKNIVFVAEKCTEESRNESNKHSVPFSSRSSCRNNSLYTPQKKFFTISSCK